MPRSLFRLVDFAVFLAFSSTGARAQDAPACQAELVFPRHNQHNHAPGIVECKNGDLLFSWYRGSGERSSDDAAIFGARLRPGAARWSESLPMADHAGFPDCNTTRITRLSAVGSLTRARKRKGPR